MKLLLFCIQVWSCKPYRLFSTLYKLETYGKASTNSSKYVQTTSYLLFPLSGWDAAAIREYIRLIQFVVVFCFFGSSIIDLESVIFGNTLNTSILEIYFGNQLFWVTKISHFLTPKVHPTMGITDFTWSRNWPTVFTSKGYYLWKYFFPTSDWRPTAIQEIKDRLESENHLLRTFGIF